MTSPGGEQDGVAVGDIARPERRPDRPDLIPGRDDRRDGPPGDLQRGVPGRGGSGQIGRAQAVAGRDEQLAGREVLARGAHVQPARRRSGDLRATVGAELDPLALHHRVHAGRHQVAGIHPGERAGGQLPYTDGSGDSLDGDAIHRGAGGTGRGPAGTDRSRRHPAEPVPHRHPLGCGLDAPPRRGARVHPSRVGRLRAGPRSGCGSRGRHQETNSRCAPV